MSLQATSEIRALVASWWTRPEWELRHLARNLVLDCPSLDDPGHPDLPTSGNRLDADAERQLDEAAGRLGPRLADIESRSTSWVETWSGFGRELQKEGRRLCRSCGAAPATDPRGRLVRYVDCRAVYQHWLSPASPGTEPDLDEIRRGIEFVLEHPRRFREWSSMGPTINAASLFLSPPGRIAWLTPDTPAPHQRPELATLAEVEKAVAVVRLMGLPGYHGEEDRREKVGLVAATCELDPRALLVPTVLHALENPYFFPGYQREAHGRVASLDDEYRSPWQRDDASSTVTEWIHENVSLAKAVPDLELVGFFDD